MGRACQMPVLTKVCHGLCGTEKRERERGQGECDDMMMMMVVRVHLRGFRNTMMVVRCMYWGGGNLRDSKVEAIDERSYGH